VTFELSGGFEGRLSLPSLSSAHGSSEPSHEVRNAGSEPDLSTPVLQIVHESDPRQVLLERPVSNGEQAYKVLSGLREALRNDRKPAEQREQTFADASEVVSRAVSAGAPLPEPLELRDSELDTSALHRHSVPKRLSENEQANIDEKQSVEQRMAQVNALMLGVRTKAGKAAVRDAATNFEPAKGLSFVTTARRTIRGNPAFMKGFNFRAYLEAQVGPPPPDMYRPHPHHILFQKGNGVDQERMVEAGKSILEQAGIDPTLGIENLAWAPMGIDEQHGFQALKQVLDTLRKVEAIGGDREDFVEALKTLGEIAAARK
jgi:hypothetical protein